MSDTTTPKTDQKIIDATSIVDSLKFRTGVSAKTGNPYIIGTLYIKTARGRAYGFDLKYIDENGEAQIEDALEAQESNDADREDFKNSVLGGN